MVIYLKHPVHGTKIAISEEEALYDEKFGWTRYDAGTLMTPDETAPDQLYVEDINELRKLWQDKHGAAPHHRKSADTLRKELETS